MLIKIIFDKYYKNCGRYNAYNYQPFDFKELQYYN